MKNTKLPKFEERTTKGFLVGCNDDSYTICEAETGKFIRSKNVDFIENKVYGDMFPKAKQKSVLEMEGRERENEFLTDTIEISKADDSQNSPSQLIEALKHTEINWLEFFENNNNFTEILNLENDPLSYAEALSSAESENWKIAIKEELNSMNKNNTWSLIKRNEINSSNILTSKWVFRKKISPDGKMIYKARLVIRGFQDKNIYDRTEIYAPVIRLNRFSVSYSNIK